LFGCFEPGRLLASLILELVAELVALRRSVWTLTEAPLAIVLMS
jgi:hypothetical protein